MSVKQKPMVSVIVPIYNVEKYLKRCVDSLLAQDYPNYEIILVDDESPDRCGELCDEYAAEHPCIRVLHQKNQGLSGARNSAVPISTGEYITFVDSDDFVSRDYISYLMALIQNYTVPVAVADCQLFYDGDLPQETSKPGKQECLNTTEALKRMCYSKGFSVSAWAKIYRRDLVEKYPYPIGKLYEDLATTYKIFGDCESIAVGSKKIYYWYQRAGSITNDKISKKQLYGVTAALEQLKYIQAHYLEAESAAMSRCIAKAIDLLPKTFGRSSFEKECFKKLQKLIRRYAKVVIKDPNVRLTIKLRLVAALLGRTASKLVFSMHAKAKKCFAGT